MIRPRTARFEPGLTRVFLRSVLTVVAALLTVLVALPAVALVPRPQLFAVSSASPGAAGSPTSHTNTAVEPRSSDLDIRITSVTPAVATPGAPVTVRVTLTNNGDRPLADVSVRALIGTTVLGTRDQLSRYAEGLGSAVPSREVAGEQLAAPLAPGEATTLELPIVGNEIHVPGAFGVRPLLLEAEHGDQAAIKRSFLPVHARAEYQPLRMSFVVPLTMDPDPRLVLGTGAERDQAWTQLAGPDGRIDDILRGTGGHQVTYAVDPTLLGYTATPRAPAGTGGRSTSSPGPLPESKVVGNVVRSVAERITAPEASIWELPPGDPDVDALSAEGVDARLLQSIGADNPDLGRLLTAALGEKAPAPPAEDAVDHRFAWSVGGALDNQQRIDIDQALSGGTPDAETVFVQQTADVDPQGGTSPTAARRTPGGSPLIVTDTTLNGVLSGAGNARRSGETAQRFLAESLTLLAQSPGVTRDVVVAVPRDFAPDATALAETLTAAENAPWIQVTPADQVLDRAGTTDAPVATPVQRQQTLGRPLDATDIDQLVWANQQIAGMGAVLSATSESNLIPTQTTTSALASARWRGHDKAQQQTLTALLERIKTLTTGVTVLPSTVNFLAEHGVLQVTVVNNLDVAVENVRLVLTPDERNPRLRITQPEPLSIAPGSRSTVRVSVEAVAAGVVPLSTHLETPTGTRLGSDATVNVRVQPSDGRTIAVGGAVVALVFVVGLIRTLRRGRPRASDADLRGIDLE